MKYNLNKNKNNSIVTTTATLLTLAAIIAIVAGPTAIIIKTSRSNFKRRKRSRVSAAPVAVSGDNIYIAWWTNNTENGNEEVMFRASTDGGATFSDRINLSNTTEADSWRVELHGEGDTVVVSWWETNQTSDTPVAKISTHAGETFGPMLRLATNATISGTEGGEEAETVEEEAVGGADVVE
jgi:hypothetical protein